MTDNKQTNENNKHIRIRVHVSVCVSDGNMHFEEQGWVIREDRKKQPTGGAVFNADDLGKEVFALPAEA